MPPHTTGGRPPPPEWRRLLEERAEQAAHAFGEVDGVAGLIVAGSVGRGEPWPLSDIDLIPLYEDARMAAAVAAVEARRNELLDWWAAEGVATCLDVGKLAFTRSEAARAVARPPAEASALLGDPRWFHSLDKAYGGRAARDPDDPAGALARWLSEARFAPAVVRGRLDAHRRAALAHHARAARLLGEGDALHAAVALRESLHALSRCLMEGWGERDASWGRFGTHFERTAAERGEGDLAATVMELYDLSPEAAARRLALAPEGIRARHRRSLAARESIGEPTTPEQDARDVLLAFGTREVRYRRPPWGAWVGLEDDPGILSGRIREYGRLLEERGLRPPDTAP